MDLLQKPDSLEFLTNLGLLKIMHELHLQKINSTKSQVSTWTEEEDNHLIKMILENGEKSWRVVSDSFPQKKKVKDCKNRWFSNLKSGLTPSQKLKLEKKQSKNSSFSSSLNQRDADVCDLLKTLSSKNAHKKRKIENIFSSSTINHKNIEKHNKKCLLIVFPFMNVSEKNTIESSEVTLSKINKNLAKYSQPSLKASK